MASPAKSLLSKSRGRDEQRTPGEQDRTKNKWGKISDEGMDLKDMFKNFMKEQCKVNGRRDQQHQEFVGSIKGLTDSVATLDAALKTESETREKQLIAVNTRLDNIEKTNVLLPKEHASKEENDEWRDFQVIVGGFGEDQDSDVIEATINDFLQKATFPKDNIKVFTFSDPAQVGVIEFPSIASKIGFYKKIANVDKSIGEDKNMWFTNNRTFERRARDKALGQIKHLSITKCGFKLEDVNIQWKHGTVKIKGKKVATVSDGGNFKLQGEGEAVKQDLSDVMKKWFDKKGADAPYE